MKLMNKKYYTEKMVEATLKFFLIFSLSFNYLQAQERGSKVDNSIIDTNSVVLLDLEDVSYPGKPLIMSLILPGSGQFYNKSPLWKTASFFGFEIATIVAWNYFQSEADKYKEAYQSYADQHWSLSNWVINSNSGQNGTYDGRAWSSFSALTKLSGTHHMNLIVSGTLAEELGFNKVSSDSLDSNPEWGLSDDVIVVRDRHFYENIGKYDQFLGGWDDANSEWYWEEKDVGDSLEIIIKTPKKQDYIDQRYNANQMLSRVKYSVTALMFNHVVSGIESVLTSQKNAKKNKIHNDLTNGDYKINLTYNPLNNLGIGGVNLSILF